MRAVIGAMTLAVLGAVAGASAQPVTTMRESLNYQSARTIVHTCEDMAASHNWKVAIWVLDISGQPLYFAAINDPTDTGVKTAEMKARTALNGAAPSESKAQNLATPAGARAAEALGYFPVAGGIPVIRNGHVIGAVGAGGIPPVNGQSMDQVCAQAGIDAVFKK